MAIEGSPQRRRPSGDIPERDVVLDDDVSADDERLIQQGLTEFGDQHTAARNHRPVRLALRSADGRLIGGLLGSMVWDWLQVDALWVAQTERGRGHGRELLRRAEQLARAGGCRHARADTFDFEARDFYEKLGYRVYGELQGFPSGRVQFHLRKSLESSGDRDSELAAVRIRRAGPDDAELLATIGARTFEDTFAADNTPEDMAAYVSAKFTPAKIAAELADDSTLFLIAEIDGVEAGYAKLDWKPAAGVEGARPVELQRIYVVSDWLGQGVGQALMQRCLDEARAGGADVLWLGVWERNERAIAFYRKWGFEKVGEHVFVLGSDPQTDWVMSRPV